MSRKAFRATATLAPAPSTRTDRIRPTVRATGDDTLWQLATRVPWRGQLPHANHTRRQDRRQKEKRPLMAPKLRGGGGGFDEAKHHAADPSSGHLATVPQSGRRNA